MKIRGQIAVHMSIFALDCDDQNVPTTTTPHPTQEQSQSSPLSGRPLARKKSVAFGGADGRVEYVQTFDKKRPVDEVSPCDVLGSNPCVSRFL